MNPATAALLVVDMQRYFEPMVGKATPNIVNLIESFRSAKCPIFFTQHGHSQDELSGKVRNMLVRRWGATESIATGSPGWEFIEEIDEQVKVGGKETTVVPKNSYDAFVNTNLERMLRDKAVEKLVVCGVMTDFCCDTSARSAFNRGFDTWLVRDACGSTSESTHKQGLKSYEKLCGDSYTTSEVLEVFEEKKGRR